MPDVEIFTAETEVNHTLPKGTKKRTVVVATDGSENALAAYSAARLIQTRTGAAVHVFSALEELPLYYPPTPESGYLAPPREDTRDEIQREHVERQIEKYDHERTWTTDVGIGRTADAIAEFAQENGADLIIVGLNRHSMLGRLLGEDTAMEIARLTEIPLLVVSPEMNRLPKRVTVAMGLNAHGLAIVPDVLPMITDARSVVCLHVKPRSEWMEINWADFDGAYDAAMKHRFAEVESDLAAVHLRPDLVVRHGEAAHELINYAEHSRTELIVVGIKRRRGRSRAVGGRLAGRVLRKTRCSVLIVPGPGLERVWPASSGEATSVVSDTHLWSAVLHDFTARNAGRIANIEIDDADIGAMMEATRYPLLGVDYDHKDGRITIAFGGTHGTERHFTRSVDRPVSVSILQVNHRDKALSIKHESGQTLVQFED